MASGLKDGITFLLTFFSETSDLFLVFLYHSLFFSGDVVLVSMSGPAPSARPAPTVTGQTPSKMPKIDFSRFVLSSLHLHPSIDWLFVWLIKWMIDWSIDWLIDWFDSIRVPGASGASTSRQDTSSRPPAGASAELSQAQQFLEATRREIEADPEAMERLGKVLRNCWTWSWRTTRRDCWSLVKSRDWSRPVNCKFYIRILTVLRPSSWSKNRFELKPFRFVGSSRLTVLDRLIDWLID